jgi:hypothetical protein
VYGHVCTPIFFFWTNSCWDLSNPSINYAGVPSTMKRNTHTHASCHVLNLALAEHILIRQLLLYCVCQ